MGRHPTDLGQDFIKKGMRLITQTSSDALMDKARRQKEGECDNCGENPCNPRCVNADKYKIPEDRMSRPCGGPGGFDDFVERWHE